MMKILVINLLRLGDVIMTVPVVNGLAKRRADAQIDMLTFKGPAQLHAMIPAVNRWWSLDREELQDGLGRADVPMLSSFAVLQEQLDAINAEKYDLIINLTQTKFSAYVAGYLKASDRLGLTYDLKGTHHFYSRGSAISTSGRTGKWKTYFTTPISSRTRAGLEMRPATGP